MTVDAQLVTRKLLLIAGDLDQLLELHVRGRDAYLVSRTEQAVAERLLERIVTRMIDVNYHLVTAAGHMPPKDYHASFVTLAPGATGRLTARHYGSFNAALSCAAVSPFTYTGVPASNSRAFARPPTTTGSNPASVTSRTVVAIAS